jgi:hypothetical protein
LNRHADASVQHLLDRIEIIRIVDEIDNAVDAKEWERCRGYFTEEIYADFTSLAGGSPGNMPADGGQSTDFLGKPLFLGKALVTS